MHTDTANSPFLPGIDLAISGLKRKTAHEWSAPCPRCGGEDRCFIVADSKRNLGYRFHCRQCDFHGDAIDYLMAREHVDYAEAARRLGVAEPASRMHWPSPPRPVMSMPRPHAILPTRTPLRMPSSLAQAKPAAKKPEPDQASTPSMPNEIWRKAAERFLGKCQATFTDEAQAAFAARGIGIVAARALNIGYNPQRRYVERQMFGLPVIDDKDGQRLTKVALPAGIVIGNARPEFGIISLTVRRSDADIKAHGMENCRYWQVAGGADLPFVALAIPSSAQAHHAPLVLIESALDAALIWQTAQGRITCIALQGAEKSLDSYALDLARKATRIWIAPDADEAGVACAKRLREQFPQAGILPPVGGAKDPGEMARAGVNLREWLQAFMEPTPAQEPERPCARASVDIDAAQPPEPGSMPGQEEKPEPEIDYGQYQAAGIRTINEIWQAYFHRRIDLDDGGKLVVTDILTGKLLGPDDPQAAWCFENAAHVRKLLRIEAMRGAGRRRKAQAGALAIV